MTATASPAQRRWSGALVAILAVGVVLRLATLAVPSALHPDESFQYLEAAHRQVFGYGVVTWEYRLGMRSWLMPTILAAPMAIGNALAPGGTLYYLLPRLLMVASASTMIVSAWTLGARVSRLHALFAAVVAATWYELVAFGGHPISEGAALSAATGAAALMFGPVSSRMRLFWAGALVALALALRFQFAPGLLVLVAFAGGRNIRGGWLPMASGGLAMVAISSLVDLAHGTLPFQWLLENVHQNIVLNKAAKFGEAPATAYLGAIGSMWNWASVPIAIAAYEGMKRQPALFWAAIVHLLAHSLIAHKEYRFIILTDGFLVILAAIGTVDLLAALERRIGARWHRAVIAGGMALWLSASAALAADWRHRPLWTARATTIGLVAGLRNDPQLCGVAIIGVPVFEFGGYAALHRDVPIYLPDATAPRQRVTAARLAPAYNALLVTANRHGDVPAAFRKEMCRSTAGEYVGDFANAEEVESMAAVCVYRRPGGCDAKAQRAAEPLTINPVLARQGR